MTDSDLLKRFFAGDRIALARMISRAENSHSGRDPVLDDVYTRAKNTYRIGITGPPGAGKSTLLDRMVVRCRKAEETVGIIAIDPSSPFTGGAILGDRIRMNSVQQDPGVFIRSMATRGSLGGIADKTQEIADVFAAFGKDVIFLETVGVGQSELDVIQASDTVAVILVPESGDSIQAMKAGLMEIADLFVLNKSDHENAKNAYADLRSVLHMNRRVNGWQPPIVQTVANRDDGVDELMEQINRHKAYLKENHIFEKKRKERVRERLRSKVLQQIQARFWDEKRLKKFTKGVEDILNGSISYAEALDRIIE